MIEENLTGNMYLTILDETIDVIMTIKQWDSARWCSTSLLSARLNKRRGATEFPWKLPNLNPFTEYHS